MAKTRKLIKWIWLIYMVDYYPDTKIDLVWYLMTWGNVHFVRWVQQVTKSVHNVLHYFCIEKCIHRHTYIQTKTTLIRHKGQFLFFLMFVYLFIYFEKEREQGRGRERGRHRVWSISRLRAVSTESDMGLELMNLQDHDLSQSRILNRLSHPGVLTIFISGGGIQHAILIFFL